MSFNDLKNSGDLEDNPALNDPTNEVSAANSLRDNLSDST
jgi:hypothetical protein